HKLGAAVLLLIASTLLCAQAWAQTHTATLTWADDINPAAQTTYSVYRAAGLCSGTPSFAKLAAGISGMTFPDSSVTVGTWCYQVTATVNGIESPPSPQASATVGPAAPGQITIVIK